MHKIREIREYPPIHVLFSRWKEEKEIVFLDSSLENRLGRYSIIGRLPYQKLVQDGDSFCVNDEKQKMTFENYLRTYLKEHPDSNESNLPIVSGAMGYVSYDYGREKENVAARHPKEVDMPDVILCFYDNFIIEDHQENVFILWQTVRPKRWIRCLTMWKTQSQKRILCGKTVRFREQRMITVRSESRQISQKKTISRRCRI